MALQHFLMVCFLNAAWGATTAVKRGIYDYSYVDNFNVFEGLPLPLPHHGLIPDNLAFIHGPPPVAYRRPFVVHQVYVPSPAHIASAIQAAKEASSHVASAQQLVGDAKDALLHQQHVSDHKQAQAALALQKTEAAAAVQHQEAKSAATSLVKAQQRLGRAKSEVANLQKIASAKEAHAAAIIQKAAAAAEAEIHKSDEAAKKISNLHHSNVALLKQEAAVKEGLSATSIAVEALSDRVHGSTDLHHHQPFSWVTSAKFP